jgi:hypothetical protein
MTLCQYLCTKPGTSAMSDLQEERYSKQNHYGGIFKTDIVCGRATKLGAKHLHEHALANPSLPSLSPTSGISCGKSGSQTLFVYRRPAYSQASDGLPTIWPYYPAKCHQLCTLLQLTLYRAQRSPEARQSLHRCFSKYIGSSWKLSKGLLYVQEP